MTTENKTFSLQKRSLKLAKGAIVASAIFLTPGFLIAFLIIPPVSGAQVSGSQLIGDTLIANKLLLSQKIFYFHMPVAIVSFVSLIFAGVYSARYLITGNGDYDIRAYICMELALLFVAMTMISGEAWTRFEWGVWWTWDPRLTTYLILMLIVIAYIVLRSMVDQPESKARFSAILALVAVVDVPICFMITRIVPSSVHPVVVRQGGMSADMGICIAVVIVGMAALAFALFVMRYHQVIFCERVRSLQERLDQD